MASLRGNTEFLKACQKIRDDGVNAIRDVNREQAREVLNKALSLVPVDTGKLRDSAKISQTKTGATITFTAPYAAKVEFSDKIQRKNGQRFFLHQPMTESIDSTVNKWQTAFLGVIQANSQGG